MKKIFFRYTTGFIPLIALCSGVWAQDNFGAGSLDPNGAYMAYHKAKPRNILVQQGTSSISINARAVKDFSKTYRVAGNASWFELKDGYQAKFQKDGITTKVYYDKKGRLVGSIRSYSEDKLARNIRHQVKTSYYDYDIFYIYELTAGDKTIYFLKLEGKDEWKTVKMVEGEIEETESFKKSN